MGECGNGGTRISIQVLGAGGGSQGPGGVPHPFPAIQRLALLGLVCGQTTMAHIALVVRMHWPMPQEPLGFVRDLPFHAATISRTPAGVSHEQ